MCTLNHGQLEQLANQFRPVADVQEVGFLDVLSYLRNIPMRATQLGQIGLVAFVESKIKQEYLKKKIIEIEGDEIKKWLTAERKKEARNRYFNEVTNLVISSAGHLKTLAAVSASFRPLDDFYQNSRCPPELEDLEANILDEVLVLKAHKSWWDWRAFAVAMIGVAQIVVGAALVATGVLATFGAGLISEGVGDIAFAIQAGVTGTFSWSSYGRHKLFSGVLMILTAGIGTYLTWGARAGRVALAVGRRSIFSVIKTVLSKVGQAAYRAFVALGVEKFLNYLKDLILKFVVDHVKDTIVGKLLFNSMDKLKQAMNDIWQHMKKAGRSVAEAMAVIDRCLVSSSQTMSNSTWANQVANQSLQVGKAMSNCFIEATADLKQQEGALKDESKSAWAELSIKGNEYIDLAKQAVDVAGSVHKWTNRAKKAITVINVLKNGSEVTSLMAHGPEYVDQVSRDLVRQAHDLQMKSTDEQRSQTQATDGDAEEFEIFQKKKMESVQTEVVDHIVSRIQNVWVQPWMTKVVEGTLKSVAKKTVLLVGSLLEDEETDDADKPATINQQKSKANANRRKKKGLNIQQDLEADLQLSVEEMTELDAMEKNSGVSLDQQVDHTGQLITLPKSFEEAVESIGKGGKSSTWVTQLVADCIGPLEIVDTTGQDLFEAEGKNYVFKCKGKNSNGKAIKLNFSAGHVSHGPDDSSNARGDGTPNNCLFDAIGKAVGLSSQEVIEKTTPSTITEPDISMKME